MRATNQETFPLLALLAFALCLATPAAVRATAPSPTEKASSRDGLVQQEKYYVLYLNDRQIQQPGWRHFSKAKQALISKNGHVVSRLEKSHGFWRFFKYNRRRQKWTAVKKAWKTVGQKSYYFDSTGKCTRIYNKAAHKYYDCRKNKTILVKNSTRIFHGKRYYFKPNGVKASSAGVYLTSAGKLVRVRSSGLVTKIIPGRVLEYTASDGKITASRVKDSHYMCYYNAKGILTRKINLDQKMAALTYDDGPSQYTPVILDVLEKYSSRATFFVVGDRVSAYASTVKRTQEMGCEIGNHTYSHTILTSVGIPDIQNQIAMTNQAVQNITGVAPAVMRPPGGGHNATVQSAVGMPLILWSIDTLDWKTRSAPATQAAVLDSIQDGDVVLMHDLHGPTAEASKTIIPELVNRGYQLLTVSELAHCRGSMTNGGVYSVWRN